MLEEHVISGPLITTSISSESLGLEIYKTLKSNYYSTEPAIIDNTSKTSISYKNLLDTTCQIAEWFKVNGCYQNDIIGICSENNINFFKPVIAALYNGVISASINSTLVEGELVHALDLVEPKIVFCSKNTFNKLLLLYRKKKTLYIKKLVMLETLDELVKDVNINGFFPIRFNPYEQIAAILYSSGTTGLPKGVMIMHSNINMRNSQMYFRLPKSISIMDERTVITVPFYHAYGFVYSLGLLKIGKTLLFLQKFDEHLYLQTIQDYKINILMTVPPLMVFLAKSPIVDKYDLSSIKEIMCGAAPLSKELEEAVKKRLNVPFIKQGFGMTETTLGVISYGRGEESKLGSSGKPLPGISIKILDLKSRKNLGPNLSGELCVKGGVIMKGYYKNPEATRNTITKDGWLLTGDIAYYDEEGYVYIVDRLKELIKYNGNQVAPAELEGLLLTHPEIKDAAVIGIPDDKVGEVPLAFIVKTSGSLIKEKDVKNFIAKQVSKHKLLRGGVKFIDVIPRNPSGKILRKNLRELVKQWKSKL